MRLASSFLLLAFAVGAHQRPPAPLPGQVDLHRTCSAKPGQTYALYLPSSYNPTKKWPIIYAFDPSDRGDRPIDVLKAEAEKYGYIVTASNNSRNGAWAAEIEAAQAVSEDTHAIQRFLSSATGFDERVIPLDIPIAELAAQVSLETKMAMADAIIYASARQHRVQLVTSDAHFNGLPWVTMI